MLPAGKTALRPRVRGRGGAGSEAPPPLSGAGDGFDNFFHWADRPSPLFPVRLFFSRLLRWRVAALAAAGALAPCRLPAQLTVTTPSAQWTSSGVVWSATDPVGDTDLNRPSIDFVGDSSQSAFLTAATGDALFFRFRLNTPMSAIDAPGVFFRTVAVGIDLNGNGSPDIGFAVSAWNTPNANLGHSFFARFGESRGAPDDRWNFGPAYGSQDWALSGPTSDFNYSLVSTIDGAVGDVAGSTGPNTLLTFSVSYSRLQDAIRALGGQYASYTVDSSTALDFRFTGHSGTQSTTANVDYVAGGQIIPEIPTAAFLAVALLPALVWRAGRRCWRATRRGH